MKRGFTQQIASFLTFLIGGISSNSNWNQNVIQRLVTDRLELKVQYLNHQNRYKMKFWNQFQYTFRRHKETVSLWELFSNWVNKYTNNNDKRAELYFSKIVSVLYII